MDDKQAILAEIHGALSETEPQWERQLAEEFAICAGDERPDDELLFFALAYLAAKRRYEKVDVVTQPVTRMSFDEWLSSTADHGNYADPISRMHAAWNAALANVPPPETDKRFEVGDEVIFNGGNGDVPGIIKFVSREEGWIHSDPVHIRLAPKVVALTYDEKVRELERAIGVKDGGDTIFIVRRINRALATGKTLDQLCAEYSVATTRSV